MEPVTILGLAAIANAAASLFNNRASNKRQSEIEELRRQATEKLQQGQHEHAKEMFELARKKELELIEAQFQNQIELTKVSAETWRGNEEFKRDLDTFPLMLTPSHYYDSPETLLVITRHGAIRDFGDATKGSISYSERVTTLDANLSLFLRDGYRASDSVYGVWFPDGSWRNQDLIGGTAAAALYKFLKGRATLFIEYQDVPLENRQETSAENAREIRVNLYHWEPGAEKMYDPFTFSRFNYLPSETKEVIRKLQNLQALASGAVADVRAITRKLARPLLPGRLQEIIADGNDDVILRAVSIALNAYLAAITERGKSAPARAAILAAEIAIQLAGIPAAGKAEKLLEDYSQNFLSTSLQMFIGQRGGAAVSEGDLSALLNQATALRLPQDDDYFAIAKSLRGELQKRGLERGLIVLPPGVRLVLPPAESNLTFGEKLETVRTTMKHLKSAVETLISKAPESLEGFANHAVSSASLRGEPEGANLDTKTPAKKRPSAAKKRPPALNAFLATLQQSIDQLERPLFRLTPVAVTNAGKSTLLSALIGRGLAPIASGEVSMGMLRFIHRSQGFRYREVRVDRDNGLAEIVEEREFDGKPINHDASVAEEVLKKMIHYKENGFKQGEPFPIYEIETPLLIGNFSQLIGLPEEVGVEIIDLPGLNSTDNDDRNLAIIQSAIRGSFCLFVLDWNTTSEEKDENLLRKVREMLLESGADPESVIFVLNKFDERRSGDTPERVEKRLAEFRDTLRRGLKLEEPPELIPMCGSIWFHAQTAWGPSSLSSGPSAPQQVREAQLDNLAVDDISAIQKFFKETGVGQNDQKRIWSRNNIEPGIIAQISDDDFLYLMEEIVYPASGAQMLFDRLADRFKRRCVSLIIRPLVIDSLRQTESFVAAVSKRYLDAQIEKAEEITDEIERIRRCTEKLRRAIDDEMTSFSKLARASLEAGTKLGGRKDADFHKLLADKKIDLNLFQETVSAVSRDLAPNVAQPFRNFKPEQAAPDSWQAVLRKQRVDSLYAAANKYFNLLKRYQPGSEPDKAEYAFLADGAKASHVTETEKAYEALMKQLVEAVGERSSFIIQQRLAKIAEQAQKLMTLFYERVTQSIKDDVDEEIIKTILAGKLPPPNIGTEVTVNFEALGKTQSRQREIEVREEKTAILKTTGRAVTDSGRWLWRKLTGKSTSDLFEKVKKIVYVKRLHNVSIVSNGLGIQEDANKIFELKKGELQKELDDWFAEMLNRYASELGKASEKVAESLRASLQAQLARTSEERQKEIEDWKRLDATLSSSRQLLDWLRRSVTDASAQVNA
jgi:GTPase SAR1 family protein